MNSVILIGNLTRDPEIKETSTTKLCKFSMAYKNRFTKDVYFFDCTAWGKLAEEVVMRFCQKGDKIAVRGELQQDAWVDKDNKRRTSIRINVDEVTLLKNRGVGSEAENKIKSVFDGRNPFSDDDIPFK